MTILVDMDDVLEQLVVGWVQYVNERFGTSTTAQDVCQWDMSKAFPTLTHAQVYSAINDDALWDYVHPMPGAAETLQKLTEDGHQIFIVTATGYQTLRAKMEKVLFRYFPFLQWHQVIITEHKQMIQGDVLIDDGPHNLAGGQYRKLLFDAGHNRNFDEASIGAVRVHNWNEVYQEITKMTTTEELT